MGLRGLTPIQAKADNYCLFTPFRTIHAEVAKLADALDSGSSAPWGVRVRIPPSAPFFSFVVDTKKPTRGLSQNPTKLSASDKDVVTLTKMRCVHFVKLQ